MIGDKYYENTNYIKNILKIDIDSNVKIDYLSLSKYKETLNQ